jgi:hypothetical protein
MNTFHVRPVRIKIMMNACVVSARPVGSSVTLKTAASKQNATIAMDGMTQMNVLEK